MLGGGGAFLLVEAITFSGSNFEAQDMAPIKMIKQSLFW